MIDIIVPTYNRPDDIKKFVFEIQKQTYKNFNIFIIDDNSTDNIQELIPVEDLRFKYYKLDKNQGQAFARNFAVNKSTSRYLFFLDDDAYFLDENALANFINKVKDDDSDGWMFDVLEPQKKPLSTRINFNSGDSIGEFIACACAFKRQSFLESGGFLPYFHSYGEETEIVMRMILQNKKMSFLPEIKVYHNYLPTIRNRSWKQRFMRNSMRNDVYIILLHYPFYFIPFYFFGKFFSRLFFEFRHSENKFDSFFHTLKGLLEGLVGFIRIFHTRKALSYNQFLYWKKIRW